MIPVFGPRWRKQPLFESDYLICAGGDGAADDELAGGGEEIGEGGCD
jgi:hypothetical protein